VARQAVRPTPLTARRLFPVVALAIGLLAAIGLAESMLRLWVWIGVPASNGFIRFMKTAEGLPGRGRLFRPSGDPSLGIECVPNSRRGHIRINSWGFRGDEVGERPAPGVVRIAMVGDSETFGAALPEEKTLPGCLAATLNAAKGPGRYEVLNLGVPGYNTRQELRVVETRLPRLHPDIVILYYVLNDPELSPRTVLLHGGGVRSLYVSLLASYLSKARWPADVADLRGQMSTVDYYHYLHDSDYFETTRKLILEMAALLRRRGVRFVLVIAPEVYGIRGFKRYPYRDIHERLARLGSPDLEVVDPLDRLGAEGKRPRRYWVSPDDPHKNEDANRIIAAVVTEALLKAEKDPRP
jgi:lysophospholipase L1-like esterase